MKAIIKLSLLFLLLSLPLYSQVGISTTTPTETLDVNGSARVRSLTNGTVQSSSTGVLSVAPYKAVAMAVCDVTGGIYKSFGIANVVRLSTTTYRVTFIAALPNNDYVVNFSAKQRLLSYDNVTVNGFDIIVNTNPNPVPSFDFNFSVFLMY